MQNSRLDEVQAGIKIDRRNINKLTICRWHHPYRRMWRGTKEPLDESERGELKSCLKLNIQKTKIVASSPIPSWQIDGERVETVSDFIFLAPKSLQMVIAAIKFKKKKERKKEKHLLLWRKVMTNLDSILKSSDITLPAKVRLVKTTVFPLVMYGCDSWTVKKAECRRIDAFELWYWRRLLRSLALQGDPTSPS